MLLEVRYARLPPNSALAPSSAHMMPYMRNVNQFVTSCMPCAISHCAHHWRSQDLFDQHVTAGDEAAGTQISVTSDPKGVSDIKYSTYNVCHGNHKPVSALVRCPCGMLHTVHVDGHVEQQLGWP